MENKGSEDDDEDLSDMRLLFDDYEPKVTRSFSFDHSVNVEVVCAEQNQPGALQSGVFLWPAASALGKFLVSRHPQGTNFKHVIELGAGCGLAGLVAARLLQMKLEGNDGECGSILFTDRDYTSLKMIRQSIKASGGFGCSIKVGCRPLLWKETSDKDDNYKQLVLVEDFDLAIGSDLVYSTESANALIGTLNAVMPRSNEWKFILSSSFRDPETTAIIDRKCKELDLIRTVLFDDFEKCLIEEYRRRSG